MLSFKLVKVLSFLCIILILNTRCVFLRVFICSLTVYLILSVSRWSACTLLPVSLWSCQSAVGFQSGLDCLSSLATSPSSFGHRAFCFCHSLVVWLGSPGCPVQPVTTRQPHPPTPQSDVSELWISLDSFIKYEFSKGDPLKKTHTQNTSSQPQ